MRLSERAMRVTLWAVGIYHLAQGAFMWLAPGTFFEEVGEFGVRNDHYIGDVATFTLAAGVGLILAVSRPSWRAPLFAVGIAWYGLHAINHLIDAGEAGTSLQGWGAVVLLGIGALGSAYMTREATRLEREAVA